MYLEAKANHDKWWEKHKAPYNEKDEERTTETDSDYWENLAIHYESKLIHLSQKDDLTLEEIKEGLNKIIETAEEKFK